MREATGPKKAARQQDTGGNKNEKIKSKFQPRLPAETGKSEPGGGSHLGCVCKRERINTN